MQKNDDVLYSVVAFMDLQGFASHLEVGSNDLRTKIGKEALERLYVLEDALKIINSEKKINPNFYPNQMFSHRINDSLIFTIDIDEFLRPAIGDTVKNGFTSDELMEKFDFDSLDNEEEFEVAFDNTMNQCVRELILFLGLIARTHNYINNLENEKYFPGIKTVISTGFRSKNKLNAGEDDVLSANFAFSNAYIAEKNLKGAKLYLDDNILNMLGHNTYAKNLLRYASAIEMRGPIDPFNLTNYYKVHSQESKPITVSLFRKNYFFREMDSTPISYLQIIPELTPYLAGQKEYNKNNRFSKIFDNIKNSITKEQLFNGKSNIFSIITNTLKNDVKITFEYLTEGESKTAETQRAEKRIRSIQG